MSEHWRDKMNERNQDWINSRDKLKGQAWHGGKGSGSRVKNSNAYSDGWDRIFGDKDGTGTDKEPTE